MPGPLADARHELFAQERAGGKAAIDAYVAAGFKRDTGNCTRLSQRPEVAERIIEILNNAAARVEITQSYVLDSIFNTVERCKQAVPVLDRKGQPVMIETPDGDIVPAYMFDPRSVLRGSELLGKHLGMFKETPAEPPNVNVLIGDTELARLIVFSLTKASKES